jgi:hypothetical protein
MLPRRLTMSVVISLAVSAAYPVLAEGFDGYGSFASDSRHHGHRGHHDRHRDWVPAYGGGYGVPVVIPGLGTYAGSVSALKVRGNGTYYYAEGFGCESEEPPRLAPMAKIVDATREAPCSYENGVCVIRP